MSTPLRGDLRDVPWIDDDSLAWRPATPEERARHLDDMKRRDVLGLHAFERTRACDLPLPEPERAARAAAFDALAWDGPAFQVADGRGALVWRANATKVPTLPWWKAADPTPDVAAWMHERLEREGKLDAETEEPKSLIQPSMAMLAIGVALSLIVSTLGSLVVAWAMGWARPERLVWTSPSGRVYVAEPREGETWRKGADGWVRVEGVAPVESER